MTCQWVSVGDIEPLIGVLLEYTRGWPTLVQKKNAAVRERCTLMLKKNPVFHLATIVCLCGAVQHTLHRGQVPQLPQAPRLRQFVGRGMTVGTYTPRFVFQSDKINWARKKR